MVAVAVNQIQAALSAQQAASAGSQNGIARAIQTAANQTGVNFAYLLNKAEQESNFDPNAKSSSSTATGLFQFTGQTWMRELKAHGADYGLGDYADHIKVDSSGVAHVSDPTWRRAILGLRKDPQVSAEMAGELDKENSASLKANVGGKIGSTELYLAHFLGAGGASDFLNAMHTNPTASAADILPDAAAANPSVFYTADGEPRSVGQIYKHFAQKFDGPVSTKSATMMASASTTQTPALPAATQTSTQAMAAFTLADNAAMPVAAGVYAPPSASITSNLQPSSASSMFATMVMAQMNTGDLGPLGILNAASHGNHKDLTSAYSAMG